MKKMFAGIVLQLLSVAGDAHHNSSELNLSAFGNSAFIVQLDHHRFNNPDTHYSIRRLEIHRLSSLCNTSIPANPFTPANCSTVQMDASHSCRMESNNFESVIRNDNNLRSR